MRGLRPLLLILLAALFVVGGPLRMAPAQAGTMAPACHEMAGQGADETPDQSPTHKRQPEAMAANCCVGCLPAAARDLAPVQVPARAARAVFDARQRRLEGLSLAPEHGPPRPFA